MTHRLPLALVALALAAGSPSPAAAAPKATVALPSSGDARVGSPCPWFSGWTPEGQVLNRTRVLAGPGASTHVLVVFATWCAPCRAGLSLLARGSDRLRAAGVQPLLVAYEGDGGDEAKVPAFLQSLGLGTQPVLLDRFGGAAKALGALSPDGNRASLPRTVVVGKDGTVRGIFAEEGEDYVDRILDAVRGK